MENMHEAIVTHEEFQKVQEIPVSYIHLDVYKRQVPGLPDV